MISDNYAEQCVRYMLRQYRSGSTSFDFIQALEQLTAITFLAAPSSAESLCFADSEAVRDDYKIGFTAAHLWVYVNNQLNNQNPNTDIDSFLQSIFPLTCDQFWQDAHHVLG